MANCISCGKKNEEDATYCWKCGRKIVKPAKVKSKRSGKTLFSPWCPECKKYKGRYPQCPHCGYSEDTGKIESIEAEKKKIKRFEKIERTSPVSENGAMSAEKMSDFSLTLVIAGFLFISTLLFFIATGIL